MCTFIINFITINPCNITFLLSNFNIDTFYTISTCAFWYISIINIYNSTFYFTFTSAFSTISISKFVFYDIITCTFYAINVISAFYVINTNTFSTISIYSFIYYFIVRFIYDINTKSFNKA